MRDKLSPVLSKRQRISNVRFELSIVNSCAGELSVIDTAVFRAVFGQCPPARSAIRNQEPP